MKFILIISDWLKKIAEYFITVFLGIMTIVMFSQVVSRYVFNTGLTWSEELSRYLMIWMVFLGATVLTKEGSQISVTALEEVLPSLGKKALGVLQKLITLIYFGFIVAIGMKTLSIAKLQTSPNMGIPMNLVYLIIPLAALIMILQLVLGIYLDLRGTDKQ